MGQSINFQTFLYFRRTICYKISVLNLEKMPQKHMECFRLLFNHIAGVEHQFLSGIRDSRKAGSLWGMMRGGQHSWNKVSGISTRTMHQSTTPSLSQTIWARWASRQLLTVPIVQTLLPVTFHYSLSSEAVVMRQLRKWKRLWQRSVTYSHKRTSMRPSRSCCNGTTSAL